MLRAKQFLATVTTQEEKMNSQHFVTRFQESLILAIAIVLATAVATAKAQQARVQTGNLNPMLNGVFSPTAAERFFEEGRNFFDREAVFLSEPELYFREDIIKIEPQLLQQIKDSVSALSKYEFSKE